MELQIDLIIFIFLFAALLGFLISGILLFVNKTDSFGSRLLAGFLICFSLLAVNYTLMIANFFLSHPHLWRVVGWASFSFAPFAYLYVRSVLEQSFTFKKWDFLLFIPAVLHPLGLVPFFIQPAEQKVAFLRTVADNPKLITLEPESFWPNGSSMILRIVVGISATIGQFFHLRKWKRKYSDDFLSQEQNQGIYQWLFLFSVVMAIFWGLILLEYFFHFGGRPDLNLTLMFTVSGTILFVSVYLMLQPSILYGLQGWNKAFVSDLVHESEAINKNNHEPEPEPEFKKSTISYELGLAIKKSLEEHFETNQPFRKKGYMISELSRELNLPAYLLSAFINQEYGKNFNELVNEYRVRYLLNISGRLDDFSQYTLEALGKHAGFNSRAAFIAAVKKHTGKNPSELFNRRGERKA